jgi:hypothetical protein
VRSELSGVCDLADQKQPDDDRNDPDFIGAIQNYVGSCLPADQRKVSPVSLVTFNIKNFFKPLYLVHASLDPVVPYRQVDDMACALTQGGVDPSDYKIVHVTDDPYNKEHAINLWRAPLPGDPNHKKIGDDVMVFLHANLQ